MAQEYAIGVKVLWNNDDVPFDSTVINVHPSGTVDVVFDVDGGVGRRLTKAEHIYELRGEDSKKKEKPKAVGGKKRKINVCPVDSCPNQVVAKGLCGKHGGIPCSVEGCGTKVQARGLCRRH